MNEKYNDFRVAAIKKSTYSITSQSTNSFHAKPNVNFILADENSEIEFTFEFAGIIDFIEALKSLDTEAPQEHSETFAKRLIKNLRINESEAFKLEMK